LVVIVIVTDAIKNAISVLTTDMIIAIMMTIIPMTITAVTAVATAVSTRSVHINNLNLFVQSVCGLKSALANCWPQHAVVENKVAPGARKIE
jgi:hypothetical protein